MRNQKGLAPIHIVILIGIALLGYLFYSGKITLPQKQASQSPITTSNETTNAKTYTGSSFSFQYPTDWSIKSNNDEVTIEKEHYFEQWEGGQPATLKSTIKISTKTVTPNITLDEWLKQRYQKGDDNLFELIKKFAEKTTLDGNNALHVIVPGAGGYIDEGTIAIYNGNGYDISIQGQTAFPNIREVYNQVLSTFKFLDQNQISGNKTSPNGSFVVTEEAQGDYQMITIKNKDGDIVTNDLVKLNSDIISANMRKLGLIGSGQVGYHFKEWIDDETFTFSIFVANGWEFETKVDAKTGKVDESSFKRIK